MASALVSCFSTLSACLMISVTVPGASLSILVWSSRRSSKFINTLPLSPTFAVSDVVDHEQSVSPVAEVTMVRLPPAAE